MQVTAKARWWMLLERWVQCSHRVMLAVIFIGGNWFLVTNTQPPLPKRNYSHGYPTVTWSQAWQIPAPCIWMISSPNTPVSPALHHPRWHHLALPPTCPDLPLFLIVSILYHNLCVSIMSLSMRHPQHPRQDSPWHYNHWCPPGPPSQCQSPSSGRNQIISSHAQREGARISPGADSSHRHYHRDMGFHQESLLGNTGTTVIISSSPATY